MKTNNTRKRTALLMTFMLTRLEPAQCFHATNTATRPSRTTASYFRESDESESAAASYFAFLADTLTPQQLPAWLAIPQSHLAEANMKALQSEMRESSYFTETESRKLMLAIEDAAAGDRSKVAGAAEFCLLLQETVEIGFNALVAACYHYCSCVTARKRVSGWYLDDSHEHLHSYGAHVMKISEDTDRLKRLEMVAATVTSSEPADRVRPDSKDAENLRKLLLSETHDWRALAIRSGACLYRLRGILKSSVEGERRTREAARTAREALSIYAPLSSRLGLHKLKNELEGDAFRILYPRQFAAVNSLAHETIGGDNDVGQNMKQLLAEVQQEMTTMLENDEEFSKLVENFSVTARVKEPFSMWKKMLRDGYKHVLQVPDALALRIIVDAKKLTPDEPAEVTRARDRALCYYAERLCAARWKPAPDNPRFKDYIKSPKRNGYQSLHYTAHTEFRGQMWSLEIQVRSGEMHKVAEFGLASHWDYKIAKGPESSSDVSVEITGNYFKNVKQWHWEQHGGSVKVDASPASSVPVTMSDIWQSRRRVDRIRERTAKLEPYLQAMTAAQENLAREQVFVFFGSKLMALPAGSCVLDAVRSVNPARVQEDDLVLNGSSTSLTHLLSNGDVLSVVQEARV
ncbi:hypothetical protein FisN_14Hh268 [Fistulifera solaris]|uniref:RelA/SpoT domain-containing protein n=1 Tax=Fistulifera solaris TaxID=1519565 RepID=A0A1Z5KBN0_FISSO|nr:hypothetical protein FisN_14Hh268 [Fistulifera solaris]|eukprot:GAX23555.1 hypothetical protein FisN_14Hh268 [Fistulifera solaris]